MCDIRELVEYRNRDPRNRFYRAVYRRWIGDKRKYVLIIGDDMGFDYFPLTGAGHRVVVVDVADQPHIQDMFIADACERIPFADGTFDVVMLTDVLEHVFDDHKMLKEARRVLRDDGFAVIAVPHVSDALDCHVRVHTKKTIERLAAHCGFAITDTMYRGGTVTFAYWTGKIVTLALKAIKVASCGALRGNRAFDMAVRGAVNDALSAFMVPIDLLLARHPIWFMRLSRYYGYMMRLEKSDNAVDFTRLNAERFGGQRQYDATV